jgi:hypothetical protein
VKTLTHEDIEKIKTPAGGYNADTLESLGVSWPPRAGWKQRLIGTSVANAKWKAAQKAAEKGRRHEYRGNTRGRRS